ncbi:hypothetical protein [Aliidiomarina maris]|uniref:Nlp family transcriptional regulator n=2 Tax=Aliidiomarina maris TaxID=531312 RepID=A0A327WWI6_9GAMM|nr:hypothetical protein [Aliidiomarina maris]MCL5049404.1 helix-turn-helix domain-containing protein [Bacillota bacterium]RAJ96850.1 hypothetical protein B0I24_10760 [Aliidiomarina maris]
MTKDQIKKGLTSRGYDFSMLAEVIERSPSLLSKVAARKARSLYVAEAIAKALDKSLEEVFPDVPAYHASSQVDARQLKRAELLAKLKSE